jgi:multiple sugar transport system substrate-binding protein
VGVDRKASLTELYPAETISAITAGLDDAQRWGVAEGQRASASKLINSRVVNRIARRFIDDEISAGEAAAKINAEIARLE